MNPARRSPPAATALLALAALLAGCQGYEPWRKDYAEDPTRWGPAVAGVQVGIARRDYDPGKEPTAGQVYCTVRIRNVTAAPVSILAPTKIDGAPPEPRDGDESARVRFTYESPAAGGPKTAEFKPEHKPVVQVLEPGREYNLDLRLSPAKFGLRSFDGDGRLTAAYLNAQPTIRYATSGATVSGLWTGEATSGAVELPPVHAATAAAATRRSAP